MSEDLLHDLFHAILPALAQHLDYLIGAVVVWFVREKMQVSHTQIATLLAEIEGLRAEKRGEPLSGPEKKALATEAADRLDGVFVRPRSKKRNNLIESWRPGALEPDS